MTESQPADGSGADSRADRMCRVKLRRLPSIALAGVLLAVGLSAAPGQEGAQPGYHDSAAVRAALDALCVAKPERVRWVDGGGFGAAGLSGIEIAAAGPVPPAQRPTLLVVGGLDGKSLAGSEAALALAASLARGVDALPPGITVLCVPQGSPAALDRYLALGRGDGGDATPVDDDRDGKADEDGPDDVDGDGLVLQMVIEDPAGEWVRCDDERFLVRAEPGDSPRYRLACEGQDDDGDGRFNEDGPGGVVLDRNFPLERPASSDPRIGPLPLSQVPARALADLALARRTYAVVLLQGAHASLATPGGVENLERWCEPDRALYELCLRDFRTATNRPQERPLALRAARNEDRGGLALDWFAAVPGALALEVAPWGPTVAEPQRPGPRDARFPLGNGTNGRRPPSARDRAWTSWLDNVTGGSAFVGWHPATLTGGTRVWIGGWKPWTIENPPATELARALVGLDTFVGGLATGAPKLELEARAERDGQIVRVRARVRNSGRLPTALAAGSTVRPTPGLSLGIVLEPEQRLLAGREVENAARLMGGEASVEKEWVVFGPEGKRIVLRASAPWCLDATTELAP